ncbi:hypothetical protein SLNWT_1948 [Streptomyces albus]|uniref:Uncharacterized protein n=1 Tax=Streptomyces albus (strain ATCC 21838 / DSM 41398 / FERM P-419 / JCM 4703 / NBRC 107858) TaxID=1081613 RepID=A0A0B5ELE9_STRA4|nr:hypothetical protein SLNWT_1948 [Streptomyces albus]AOU76641.1 hypothetical protein SLNHY_1950 [Streptomyces albus]AYN32423.1 hypothetical protein DUI70_1920 [Streptomyces albus]
MSWDAVGYLGLALMAVGAVVAVHDFAVHGEREQAAVDTGRAAFDHWVRTRGGTPHDLPDPTAVLPAALRDRAQLVRLARRGEYEGGWITLVEYKEDDPDAEYLLAVTVPIPSRATAPHSSHAPRLGPRRWARTLAGSLGLDEASSTELEEAAAASRGTLWAGDGHLTAIHPGLRQTVLRRGVAEPGVLVGVLDAVAGVGAVLGRGGEGPEAGEGPRDC